MEINTAIAKLQNILTLSELDQLGKETGFCQKLRKFTPSKLALSLITAFGSNTINTIAELHRAFNELIHTDSEYKPFHNQLSKKSFPKFILSVLNKLLSELYVTPVTFSKNSPLNDFHKILCHDGSSLSLKSGLSDIFPGRFTTTTPAAIELHVTMNLLSGQPEQIIMTEDTASERYQLLPIKEQAGCLTLYDRGYCDQKLFNEYNKHGTNFIIRGKKSIKPTVKNAYFMGKKHKKLIGKRINFQKKLIKSNPVDCDITWENKDVDKGKVYRMIFWWNPTSKEYVILVTNLGRDKFSINDVMDAYRLRWQIELLFKEWKSFCQLKKFDTNNQYIASGLIWVAIASSVIKRYLAGIIQLQYQIWMSTFKTAKCLGNKFFTMSESIMHGSKKETRIIIEEICEYLSKNARRSHPKRDMAKPGWNLGFLFGGENEF